MRFPPQTTAALRALATEGPIDLLVSGDCMSPRLAGGDRIRIVRRRLYLPGDIVAFRRADDRLLVHRVLGYTLSRRGLRLVAMGDRLSREDEPVPLDAVVGRVVARKGERLKHSMLERGRSLARYLRVLVRRSVSSWASAPSS